MKAIAIGVGISLLGASSPALACGGEDFHDYVLLDQPPPETVSGMILLKVSAPGPKLGFPPAPVEGVIEHASDTALIGKSVTIRMTGWSSCTYWAESPTAAYTLGRLREDAACRREGHAARSAVEHGHALLGLQPLDLLGDRGRGDVQKVRCRENAPAAVHGKEETKPAWVRRHVGILNGRCRILRLC